MNSKVGILAAGLAASLAINGYSVPIGWTDWSSAVIGSAGSAEGSLTVGGSTVGVHYTGEVNFAQVNNAGIYYYISPIPSMAAYTSPSIDNGPATTDIIGITGGVGATYTFTFDNPLVDPVMAIVSLGSPSALVSYQFDTPFTVRSSGYGYWGIGPTPLTDVGSNVLAGREAHGAIQFTGTYSSISFTAPQYENWHGFTIGAAGIQSIPEPGTLILLAIGVGLLTGVGMRRSRRV